MALVSMFAKYGSVKSTDLTADMIKEVCGLAGFKIDPSFTDASPVIRHLRQSDINSLADLASHPEQISKLAVLVNPRLADKTFPIVRECPYCSNVVYFEVDVGDALETPSA